MDQQEPGPVLLVDRGIADRRRVEIGAAALHRRHAQELLHDRIARTRDQVVRPLPEHVVDPVEPNHRLHVRRHRRMRIVAIVARKLRLVAGKRHQRHQMRASGIPDEANPVGIDAELGRLGPHELDAGFDVVDGARIGLLLRLRQPVADREQRDAVLRQVGPPILVEAARPDLPASAVHRDQNRGLVQALRPIEVPAERDPVVLDIGDAGLGADGIGLGLSLVGHRDFSHGDFNRGDQCERQHPQRAFHGFLPYPVSCPSSGLRCHQAPTAPGRCPQRHPNSGADAMRTSATPLFSLRS